MCKCNCENKDLEIQTLRTENGELLKQLEERDKLIKELQDKINSTNGINFAYETEMNCPSQETIDVQASIYEELGY